MLPEFVRLVQGLLPVAERFHAAGNLAPVAASIDAQGAMRVAGILLRGTAVPGSPLAEAAVRSLRRGFAKELDAGIRDAYLILFHEPSALAGWMERRGGPAWRIMVSYERSGDRWTYSTPSFSEIVLPPPGETRPADVRSLLVAACDHVEAKVAVERIDVTGDLASYLLRARDVLDALCFDLGLGDAGHPDRDGSGDVRAMRRELDAIAQLLIPEIPAEARASFTPEALAASLDLSALVERQLPVLKSLALQGRAEPVLARLAESGAVTSEPIDEERLDQALARATQEFAAGELRAIGIFQLGTDCVTASLQHASGRLVDVAVDLKMGHDRWHVRAARFADPSEPARGVVA